MKPRFEEHEGKLFRMLDEPEPLKEKDTNVLVQFITHGIIGKYVMEHWLDCNQENVPIFVDSVDSDGDVTVCIENGNEHICCPFPMFEIIGYPVEEGSRWWALYQMMQGKKVTKRHLISHVYWHYDASPHLKCISEYNCGILQIMVLPEIWLTTAEPTGWQIYKEPEPQYTVGDWVEFIDNGGRKSQGKYLSNSYDGAIVVRDTEYNTRLVVPMTKITRKISPSEIIVKIGCLSGTVGKSCDLGRFLMWHSKIDFDYSIIKLSALDATTLEIVQSLLKAQEGETK